MSRLNQNLHGEGWKPLRTNYNDEEFIRTMRKSLNRFYNNLVRI